MDLFSEFLSVILLVVVYYYSFCYSAHINIKSIFTACDTPAKNAKVMGLTNCRYKLIISFKITNHDLTPTTEQYAKIHAVYDKTIHRQAILLDPIVIRLRQEAVSWIFPINSLFVINNRPYEVIIHKDNTQNYTGCDTSNSPTATCGFAYDVDNSEAVTDSAGFCCACDGQPINRQHQARGGQDCSNTNKPNNTGLNYHASAHCLKFDPLWYAVHGIGQPEVGHAIHLHAFSGSYNVSDRKRMIWKKLASGDDLVVDKKAKPFSYSTDKTAYTQYTSHAWAENPPLDGRKNYLLVPAVLPIANTKAAKAMRRQIQDGASSYLVIDKDYIDKQGQFCDKGGVSFSAFSGQTQRCTAMPQDCLYNQPVHFWLQGMKKRLLGERGEYLLSNYGNVSGNSLWFDEIEQVSYVNLMFEEHHQTHLHFEIIADDLTLIHPGDHPVITEIFINTNEYALLDIHLFNAALVSSEQLIRIRHCSESIIEPRQLSAVMSPRASQKFVFKLLLIRPIFKPASCYIEVYNSRNFKTAERKIIIKAWDFCACIGYCKCSCISEEFPCVSMKTQEHERAGLVDSMPKLAPVDLFWPMTNNAVNTAVIAALFLLGLIKAMSGIFDASVAILGLGLLYPYRLKKYYDSSIKDEPVIYDEQHTAINPKTRSIVHRMDVTLEFMYNIVFFFYLPLIPIHYMILIHYHSDKVKNCDYLCLCIRRRLGRNATTKDPHTAALDEEDENEIAGGAEGDGGDDESEGESEEGESEGEDEMETEAEVVAVAASSAFTT